MKKVLIIASVISFIEWFQKDIIDSLQKSLGCEVHIACNCNYRLDTSEKRTEQFIVSETKKGVKFHDIPFSRSPFSMDNLVAYRELKKVIDSEKWTFIHCHTPMASILTRLAAKKARRKGTVLFYTCHGFHFYKGAPIINWILYFPAEKYCSRFTDVLITINKEDFQIAKEKLKAKHSVYIPGIGVDIERFENIGLSREEERKKLGLRDNDILLLSVGEINKNKNHIVVLQAIKKINNPLIKFFVAGKGELNNYLQEKAQELGLSHNYKMLGFQDDIRSILQCADIFVFPSFREGLPVSLMEAMAAGLPCVVSRIRGNVDLIDENGGFLCEPNDYNDFAVGIESLINNKALRERQGQYNCNRIIAFSKIEVNKTILSLYKKVIFHSAEGMEL